MSSEIPIRASVAHQEVQVSLEDRTYTLEFRWAPREARWYLDVSTEDREPVYSGIAVVLNFPLGIRCASSEFWPGSVFAVDTSGANLDADLDALGQRVKLVYFTAAEVA